MPYHAYIDESGVNHNETVMVVAMVIFHGGRLAEKLRNEVLIRLFGKSLQSLKARQQKQLGKQELHFIDMKYSQKLIAGDYFSKANLTCYVSYYWHQANVKSYKSRFKIYIELVKNCVDMAFENHNDMVINIAKQGGWQTYRRAFLTELKLVPERYVKAGQFRKGKFELESSAHPGIQIADFYAGASRDWLKCQKQDESARIYATIKHQILRIESMDYKFYSTKKV